MQTNIVRTNSGFALTIDGLTAKRALEIMVNLGGAKAPSTSRKPYPHGKRMKCLKCGDGFIGHKGRKFCSQSCSTLYFHALRMQNAAV